MTALAFVNKDDAATTPTVPPFVMPDALKAYQQETRWLCWKWELTEKGRWTKPPLTANGWAGSTSDPATWCSLQEAVEAHKAKGYGLGIALRGLQGLGVIDLDNVIDQNGVMDGWAAELVARAGSYTEVSPSGAGVKIFGRVSEVPSRKREVSSGGHKIELFHDCTNYVCVTGHSYGSPLPLQDITALYLELLGKPDERPKADVLPLPEGFSRPVEPQTLLDLADALRFVDAKDYQRWVDVGIALKTLGPDGWWLWDAYSRRCPSKYDEQEAREKWEEFVPRGELNIESIFWWAKQAKEEKREKPRLSLPKVDRKPIFANTIEPELNANWLIKKLMPRVGVGVIWGPPASGKTFIGFDMSASFASPSRGEWCGFKFARGVERRVGYCFLEGMSGAFNRVSAWKEANNETLDSVMIFPYALPFDDEASVQNLIDNVQEAGGVSLLVIDTLARAMNGGDENTSEGMGKAIAQADTLARELNCFVMLVHHSGKDVSKGARGWSGLNGAVDLSISVERQDKSVYRIITMEKVKDGEDGQKFGFALRARTLGLDADGDPVTSCYVEQMPVEDILQRVRAAEEGEQRAKRDANSLALRDALIALYTKQPCKGLVMKYQASGGKLPAVIKGFEEHKSVSLKMIREGAGLNNGDEKTKINEMIKSMFDTTDDEAIFVLSSSRCEALILQKDEEDAERFRIPGVTDDD